MEHHTTPEPRLGLSISEAARVLGVSLSTVRRWSDAGVLPSYRTPGGQRRYSRAEIGRVQRVSEMAGEGMTLAGIRRILVLEAEVARLRHELERERNRRAKPPHRR